VAACSTPATRWPLYTRLSALENRHLESHRVDLGGQQSHSPPLAGRAHASVWFRFKLRPCAMNPALSDLRGGGRELVTTPRLKVRWMACDVAIPATGDGVFPLAKASRSSADPEVVVAFGIQSAGECSAVACWTRSSSSNRSCSVN
jgi:hypothetical protein